MFFRLNRLHAQCHSSAADKQRMKRLIVDRRGILVGVEDVTPDLGVHCHASQPDSDTLPLHYCCYLFAIMNQYGANTSRYGTDRETGAALISVIEPNRLGDTQSA